MGIEQNYDSGRTVSTAMRQDPHTENERNGNITNLKSSKYI